MWIMYVDCSQTSKTLFYSKACSMVYVGIKKFEERVLYMEQNLCIVENK